MKLAGKLLAAPVAMALGAVVAGGIFWQVWQSGSQQLRQRVDIQNEQMEKLGAVREDLLGLRGEAFRTLSQRDIDAQYRDAGILVNLDGSESGKIVDTLLKDGRGSPLGPFNTLKLPLARVIGWLALENTFIQGKVISANGDVTLGGGAEVPTGEDRRLRAHGGHAAAPLHLRQPVERLGRVLFNDPATGVMRHADAGYDIAKQCAKDNHLNLPMLG